MGKTADGLTTQPEKLNAFMCALIDDVKALDLLMDKGLVESGVQRIGVEQELCLIDQSWRPAPRVMDVLKAMNDPHFTTEHSRYNLEINLDPLVFTGAVLSALEEQLLGHLHRLDEILIRDEAERLVCVSRLTLAILNRDDSDSVTPG